MEIPKKSQNFSWSFVKTLEIEPDCPTEKMVHFKVQTARQRQTFFYIHQYLRNGTSLIHGEN